MLTICKALTRDESGVFGITVLAIFCRDGPGVSGMITSSTGRYVR